MNEPNLTGWYAGLTIGAVAILATVVLMAMILGLARTLGAKSRDVALTVRRARRNTDAMPEVVNISIESHQVNRLLADLRRNLNSIYTGGLR